MKMTVITCKRNRIEGLQNIHKYFEAPGIMEVMVHFGFIKTFNGVIFKVGPCQ